MPRVPAAPEEPNRPLPTPYFNPGDVQGAFGGQLGGAVADVGLEVGRIHRAEMDRQRSVLVQSYVNQATTYENETLKAALDTKGKDALGITEKNISAFDKLASANEMNIRDERAKAIYRSALGSIRDRMHDAMQRHEMGQLDAIEKATTAEAQDHAVSNAALLFNDGRAIAGNLAAGERAVKASAIRNGYTPELAEGALRDFRTRVHAGVVNAYLENGQGVDAAAYLAANRDQIDGGVATELQHKVKGMADDQRVNLAADDLWKRGGGDFAKALALVKPDDPLRTRIEAALEHRGAQQDAIRVDREREADAAFGPEWNAVGRNHSRVRPDLWAGLSTKQQEWYRNAEDADQAHARTLLGMSTAERRAALQEQKEQSADRLGDLMVLSENDPAAFLTLMDDPRTITGMTDSHRIRAKGLQTSVLKQLRAGEAKAILPQDEKILIRSAVSAGLLKPAEAQGGEKDQTKRLQNQRWAGLLDAFDGWRDSYLAQHKRLPTADETQKAVDTLLIRSVHDGWFSNPVTFAFEPGFKPEETEVPASDRALIEDALKRRGRPVTEEAIRALYLKGSGR